MKQSKIESILLDKLSTSRPENRNFLPHVLFCIISGISAFSGYSQSQPSSANGQAAANNDTISVRTTSIYTFNGPQKKQLVTGAYSQISGYTVENNPVINNRNRMQGLLPGLFVMQNNGEPGDESASLWMRGKRTFRNNEPVILVAVNNGRRVKTQVIDYFLVAETSN